jgi:hypothetical protein
VGTGHGAVLHVDDEEGAIRPVFQRAHDPTSYSLLGLKQIRLSGVAVSTPLERRQ